ncbi:ABC transporter permease [Amycolatopsis sp. FDAARGOS 1241]|uniref:ABC transporter permease n=1 Tax=Amycolatopsis sp. FDAARGOS 1241 TaxID=2778070 RepID=UPI0019501BE7|nr:ABC transporter permease [Amycolatopsis sp. FDAARGOS 1241]QRP43368.1 ABC transporter permease [Amycolatopsis sp. FDAARGOS 1241]
MSLTEDTSLASSAPGRAGRPAPAARRFRIPWNAKVRRRVLPIASVVVFLGVWQIFGAQVNPILLATPSAVASSFVDIIGNGELGAAFLRAMEVLAAGFGISAVVGIAVGVWMGRRETVARVLNPYVSFFQATPLIALTPLVVIWTGIGFVSEITITFLLAVWSIIINTAEGTRNTPAILLDMAKVYRAGEWSVVRHVAMPNAVPYIFAGLRIALAKALIGVIIGEMDISLKGLGGLIQNYGDSFQTAPLLASIISSSIVGVVGTIILEVLRRRLAPWSSNASAHTRV